MEAVGDTPTENHSSYSSDDYELELPGESSTLPLQQQDGPWLEHSSSPSIGADTPAAAVPDSQSPQQPCSPEQLDHLESPSSPQQATHADGECKSLSGSQQQQEAVTPPAPSQQQHAGLNNASVTQQPIRAPSVVQSISSPRPASLWGHASPVTAATSSPSAVKPGYAELSLRCQALENALEQQQQHSETLQQALAAAYAAHAAEETSIRQYYEAQLSDRQQELQLLMERLAAAQQQAAATAADGSTLPDEAGGTAVSEAGNTAASPWYQHQQERQLSPTSRPNTHQQQPRGGLLAVSSSASSAVLADVALLRRELAQAEQLLGGYEEENRAAAKRIKDLESQLSTVKSALADEAGRAQRAAAAAAEAYRAGGAAAANRLSRQLQLEGQLESLTAAAAEREAELMQQVEQLRRDKAAAEARAAAAAEGMDMAQWQAEDAALSELRGQLSAQSAAHQHQLSELQSRLAWYAENQSLLGQSDQLVAQQAQVIRQLEAQLKGLREGGGASSTDRKAAAAAAGRIRELEQQVDQLKQLLVSRHPSSLPAAAMAAVAAARPADSAALEAAQSTIQQLQDQLDLQQQQHEHGLKALQQQYEALKIRLEQRQAQQESSGKKGSVRELTQKLDEQRSLYTRRIRALEAKLTAAQGAAAAAAASRRSSAAGSLTGTAAGSRRTTPRNVGLRAAGKATKPSAAGRAQAPVTAAVHSSSDVSSVDDEDQHTDRDLNGTTSAAAAAAAAGHDGSNLEVNDDPSADGCAVLGAVSVSSGLLRVKDRQMASLMAQLEERTSQFLQLQQKLRAAERQIKQLSAGGNRGLASRATPEKANSSPSPAPPLPSVVDGTSWPALCAELEAEVDQLKAQLAAAQQTVEQQEQQVEQLSSQLAQHTPQQPHQAAAAAGGGVGIGGVVLPPVPAAVLLSVAEEAAAREGSRWRDRVRALEEALHDSRAEASALQAQLDHCRVRGKWSPSVAAFEALERKINSLEAAQRQTVEQQKHAVTTSDMQLVVARYEQLLAAKDAELQGFRVQLDALIAAAKQLQGMSL